MVPMPSYAVLGPPRTSQDLLGPKFPCRILVEILGQILKIIGNRVKSYEFQDLTSGYFQGRWLAPSGPGSLGSRLPRLGAAASAAGGLRLAKPEIAAEVVEFLGFPRIPRISIFLLGFLLGIY